MKGTTLWQKIVKISGWKTYKEMVKHRFDPAPVDPEQFNDPRAFNTHWKPLETRGRLFPSCLRKHSVFRVSFKLRRFFVFALLLTPILISAVFYKIWFIVIAWYTVAFALIFWFLYSGSGPLIFDKKKGLFVQGRGRNQQQIPISDIQALQLLSFFFYVNTKPIASDIVYQLNIVLSSGQRVEVVTQRRPIFRPSRQAIEKDASDLARFLNVPLWDAIADLDR